LPGSHHVHPPGKRCCRRGSCLRPTGGRRWCVHGSPDTGKPARPERSLPSIFEPRQGDGSTTRKYARRWFGSGVSAQTGRVMRGDIWAKASGQGQAHPFTGRDGIAANRSAEPSGFELTGIRVLVHSMPPAHVCGQECWQLEHAPSRGGTDLERALHSSPSHRRGAAVRASGSGRDISDGAGLELAEAIRRGRGPRPGILMCAHGSQPRGGRRSGVIMHPNREAGRVMDRPSARRSARHRCSV